MTDLLDEALAAHLGRSLYDTINRHLADGQRAETAIERVRSLHQPVESGAPCIPDHGAPTWCPGCTDVCATCRDEDGDRVQSPCPTLQALDGEQPAPAPAATEATGAPDTITDPAYLRDQYAAAILRVIAPSRPLVTPEELRIVNELTTAVLAVRDRHLQQLRQCLQLADHELAQWAAAESADAAAGSYAHRAERVEAALKRVLAYADRLDQLGEATASAPDRELYRAIARDLRSRAATDDQPSHAGHQEQP